MVFLYRKLGSCFVFDHTMRGIVLERKEGEWKEEQVFCDWVSLMITNQVPFFN